MFKRLANLMQLLNMKLISSELEDYVHAPNWILTIMPS